MFGKLKEKLKQAVSIFSKKTEEEAEVEEKIIEKTVEKITKVMSNGIQNKQNR